MRSGYGLRVGSCRRRADGGQVGVGALEYPRPGGFGLCCRVAEARTWTPRPAGGKVELKCPRPRVGIIAFGKQGAPVAEAKWALHRRPNSGGKLPGRSLAPTRSPNDELTDRRVAVELCGVDEVLRGQGNRGGLIEFGVRRSIEQHEK